MYIRTKDGVYEVLSEYDTPENTTLISNPVAAFDVKVTPRTYSGASIRIIYSNEVISQSENLDELCDEFVEKCNDNPRIENPFVIPKWDKEFIKETLKRGNTIYGAIWTSKGLIYVAKMNEKGELELK